MSNAALICFWPWELQKKLGDLKPPEVVLLVLEVVVEVDGRREDEVVVEDEKEDEEDGSGMAAVGDTGEVGVENSAGGLTS